MELKNRKISFEDVENSKDKEVIKVSKSERDKYMDYMSGSHNAKSATAKDAVDILNCFKKMRHNQAVLS